MLGTRGAVGWLTTVLHSHLKRPRLLREDQALRPRKYRPPSPPIKRLAEREESTLRARRGKSELRAAEWGVGGGVRPRVPLGPKIAG